MVTVYSGDAQKRVSGHTRLVARPSPPQGLASCGGGGRQHPALGVEP